MTQSDALYIDRQLVARLDEAQTLADWEARLADGRAAFSFATPSSPMPPMRVTVSGKDVYKRQLQLWNRPVLHREAEFHLRDFGVLLRRFRLCRGSLRFGICSRSRFRQPAPFHQHRPCLLYTSRCV